MSGSQNQIAAAPSALSSDPSMEDILASIRRILTDDETAEGAATIVADDDDADDVLVLDASMMVPEQSQPAPTARVAEAAVPAGQSLSGLFDSMPLPDRDKTPGQTMALVPEVTPVPSRPDTPVEEETPDRAPMSYAHDESAVSGDKVATAPVGPVVDGSVTEDGFWRPPITEPVSPVAGGSVAEDGFWRPTAAEARNPLAGDGITEDRFWKSPAAETDEPLASPSAVEDTVAFVAPAVASGAIPRPVHSAADVAATLPFDPPSMTAVAAADVATLGASDAPAMSLSPAATADSLDAASALPVPEWDVPGTGPLALEGGGPSRDLAPAPPPAFAAASAVSHIALAAEPAAVPSARPRSILAASPILFAVPSGASPRPASTAAAAPAPKPVPPQPESPIMSAALSAQPAIAAAETTDAAAGAVSSLVRVLAADRAAQVSNNGPTIADLVREEIRPVLKAWLDTNLPPMVERLVRAEIDRVMAKAAL